MARRLECVNAFLHQPSRAAVAQNVRRYFAIAVTELRATQRLVPRPLDLVERLAIIGADIDGMTTIDPTPAPQMRQDTPAETHDRRPLVLDLPCPRRSAPHGPGSEVDPAPLKVTDHAAT